jgi:hypothetical protein
VKLNKLVDNLKRATGVDGRAPEAEEAGVDGRTEEFVETMEDAASASDTVMTGEPAPRSI